MTETPRARAKRPPPATGNGKDNGAAPHAPPTPGSAEAARGRPSAAPASAATDAEPSARARTARRATPPDPEPHAAAGRSYWIGVVARDHVALGVAGGFTQLNHGKAGALERMRAGDGFAFYSPRESHPDGPPLQAFTAIGRIRDGRVYQADAGGGFHPFRLDVAYLPAHDAPIKPMLDALSFIRSKQHWGAAFRFGIVRVPEPDFARIAAAMGRDLAADFTAGIPAGLPADATGNPVLRRRARSASVPRST